MLRRQFPAAPAETARQTFADLTKRNLHARKKAKEDYDAADKPVNRLEPGFPPSADKPLRQAGIAMSVDFNGIGPGQVNTQKTTATKSDAAPKGPQSAAEQAQTQTQAARGENVKLSSQAKDLKQLEQRLNSYPEMDDERIEQIKSALADGSYKVDAEKLAQKMLDMDESIFG